MSAVLLGASDPPQKIQVGNYTLEASYLKPRVLPGSPQPQPPFPNAAAIFIATGPDEFYVAGNGVTVTFIPNTPGPPLAGLAIVEEGVFVDGRWVPGRRLAGDDTATPGLVLPRLHVAADHPALFGPSFKGIVRVTLYRLPLRWPRCCSRQCELAVPSCGTHLRRFTTAATFRLHSLGRDRRGGQQIG